MMLWIFALGLVIGFWLGIWFQRNNKPKGGNKMKTAMAAFLLLAIGSMSVARAGDLSTLGYIDRGSCVTSYCEICDKKLEEWKESTYSITDGHYAFTTYGYHRQGEKPRASDVSFYHSLCEDCYLKYIDKYRKLMILTDKDFYFKARDENGTAQDMNRQKQKMEALKDLNRQLEELKKKFDQIEKPKPKSKM